MQMPSAARQDKQEGLCEEFMRERAAVLCRAGQAVEDALDRITAIGRSITSHLARLQSGHVSGESPLFFEQINEAIDQYNDACRKAEIQYYYLIVTREALGLRKHDRVEDVYRIPPRKKRIQAE